MTCPNCPHPDHAHPAGGACRVITVTGPPSDKGRASRASKNGYRHTGRDTTPCACPGNR